MRRASLLLCQFLLASSSAVGARDLDELDRQLLAAYSEVGACFEAVRQPLADTPFADRFWLPVSDDPDIAAPSFRQKANRAMATPEEADQLTAYYEAAAVCQDQFIERLATIDELFAMTAREQYRLNEENFLKTVQGEITIGQFVTNRQRVSEAMQEGFDVAYQHVATAAASGDEQSADSGSSVWSAIELIFGGVLMQKLY